MYTYDKIIFGFYNIAKNIYLIERNSSILILIHIDQKINSLFTNEIVFIITYVQFFF